LLQQSLQIALKHSYDDHTARVYVNLASNAVKMNDYEFAGKILNEGIQYCEERDLDIYTTYLLAFKARQYLKTGKWNEAYHIAENLIRNEDQPPIVKIEALVVMITIKMRRGDNDLLPLLTEAKEKAFEAMEPQRIIPAVTALLEYEWITGTGFIKNIELEYAITMLSYKGFVGEKSEFGFWLLKAGKQSLQPDEYFEGYNFHTKESALKAADLWKQLGCPYEQALALFEGGEDDKRKAIEIVHNLGANAVYEKLKLEMRRSGIKSIPRGIRKSTLFNPALLTDRELDILQLLHEGLHNKEIASRLFISPKTVDHHISSILFKLDVNSRAKAVQQAVKLEIIK